MFHLGHVFFKLFISISKSVAVCTHTFRPPLTHLHFEAFSWGYLNFTFFPVRSEIGSCVCTTTLTKFHLRGGGSPRNSMLFFPIRYLWLCVYRHLRFEIIITWVIPRPIRSFRFLNLELCRRTHLQCDICTWSISNSIIPTSKSVFLCVHTFTLPNIQLGGDFHLHCLFPFRGL